MNRVITVIIFASALLAALPTLAQRGVPPTGVSGTASGSGGGKGGTHRYAEPFDLAAAFTLDIGTLATK